MIINDIFEMSTYDVLDRGIPNQERIAIYINETLNLGKYGLMLGIRGPNNSARPIRDNFFWFGEGLVNRGDWIFVYTGPGEPTKSDLPNCTEKLYSLHWGREKTILNQPNIVPILFRMDAVQIPEELRALAQGQS